MKRIIIIIAVLSFFISGVALAHQPRIPEGNQTNVSDPEISKAYYSQLVGVPHLYRITSGIPFALYVNILVPDIPWQAKDFSVNITRNWNDTKPVVTLDGSTFAWTKLFEPFGYDSYWKGPEYKQNIEPGTYDIVVSSKNNTGKYSLAIWEAELFDFKETYNALYLIPIIKRDFFNESPINFIWSPFGYGLIIMMFISAFIFWYLYRFILRKFTKNKAFTIFNNRNYWVQFILIVFGVSLLILAITTSWNPFLLFLSGFILFEAIIR